MTQSFADPGSAGSDLKRTVTVDLEADASGFTSAMQQAVQGAQQLQQALGGAVQQVDSLTKRAGKSLVHFSVGDFAALSGAAAVAGRFESQLATLNATAAVTGSSMPALKRQISGVFTDFPVWRQQIVQLATAISNLAVTKPTDIGTLTRSYTKLGAATGEDSTSLASSGIQLSRQMGNTNANQIDKYNNALITLSKNAGVSASSITDFGQQIAPFARQAGIGQAAVLGIATAFQKAGADGLYAANAFNKIAQDIHQLTQSGSPEITKYASLLGMTGSQFKALDGGEQVTRIFEKVGQGGPQATQFVNNNLGGGQRMQAALTAVSQSGELRQQMGLSQASSGDTKNLDAAAEAAMGGFNESVSSLRNQFTELATAIGDPLLGPLADLTKLFSGAVGKLTEFLKALGPLPTILMAAAGVASIPAIVGLTHFGLSSGAALARGALGSGAGWRTARREGQEVGGLIAGGMSRDKAIATSSMGVMSQAGQLGKAHTAMFMSSIERGEKAAANAAKAATPGTLRSAFQGGMIAMGRPAAQLANWAVRTQNESFDDARKPFDRRAAALQQAGVRRIPVGWTPVAQGLMAMPLKSAASLGDTTRDVARTARAAVPGTGVVPALARGGLTLAAGAGTAWSGFSRGMGALGSFAMNPMTMMAGMIGIPLIAGITSKIREDAAKRKDVSGALGGAGKYDEALGTSSTNLAKFGGAVDDAANRLAKFADIPVKDLAQVTHEDIAAVAKGDYSVADQGLKDVVTASGGMKSAVLSYFDSMGIQKGDLTGDQFTKFKQDLLSTMGIGREKDVEDIMGTLAKQTGEKGGIAASASFDVLGTLASGQRGEEFKNILGAGITGIQAGTQNAGEEGETVRLADFMRIGAQATGTRDLAQGERIGQFSEMLNKFTGVNQEDFKDQITAAAKELGTRDLYKADDQSGRQTAIDYSNPEQAAEVLSLAFSRTEAGKNLLSAGNISVEELQAGAASGLALPTADQASDTRLKNLAESGQLGAAIAARPATAASLAAPGQPGTAGVAMQGALTSAMKLSGGDAGEAQVKLLALTQTVGGTDEAMKALLLGAASAAQGLMQIQAVTQTVAQNAQALAANANQLRVAASSPTANQETKDASTAAQGQAQQAGVGLLQHARGLVMQGRQADKANLRAEQDNARQIQLMDDSYGLQRQRSADDMGRAMFRSRRQYMTSTARAEEDYNRSRERQTQEFGIQQVRSEQQFNLQRSRTLEDFHTQAARAEEQYNRQRLRTLETFAIQAERTETSYQLGRQRQIEDAHISEQRSITQFNLQNQRAEEDFQRSRRRQLEEFNITQARATANHNRSMARQAEDAAKNIYDPFERIQRKGVASAASVARNLANQNKAMTRQLTQLQQAKDMGLSEAAIKTLNLADPKNAQQLDAMIKGMGQDPNVAKTINAQIQQRIGVSKKLVTSEYSTEFQREQEDFLRGQDEARKDMRRGMNNSDGDFRRSMKRSAKDFGTSIDNSRKDLNRSLNRSEHDYKVSVENSVEDLNKGLKQSAEDFATGVENSEADLKKSLDRSSTDFATSVKNSSDDFSRAMAQAGTDFITARDRAAVDQETALSDMADDFKTTSERAATDHATALDNMAIAYKTQQTRAGEDLKESFREFTGGFGEVMDEMTAQATGAMSVYAPAAAAEFLSAIDGIAKGMPYLMMVPGLEVLFQPAGGPGSSAPGAPGNSGYNSQVPAQAGMPATPPSPSYSEERNRAFPSSGGGGGGGTSGGGTFAIGGISLSPQRATVSEYGPEAHIPLNSRGEDFMAGLIAKSLARGITMAVSGNDGGGSSTTNSHVVSFAGADITVQAQDPNQMAKALEAQAKLRRLTSPK